MPPIISREKRITIIALSSVGWSQRRIAAHVGCTLPTVNRVIQAYRSEGRIEDVRRGARPSATTPQEDEFIAIACCIDPFISATDVKRELNLQASTRTIRRRLQEFGVRSSAAAQKIALSGENRIARVRFAMEHRHWSVEDWSMVIFTDEAAFSSRFNQWWRVWRPPRCRFLPPYVHRVFSSGRHSVPVWGALSHEGLDPLVHVEGRFTASAYEDMLISSMVPYALGGPFPDGCFVLQHDNSPVHKARYVQRCLDSLVVQQLQWPARSPDMNIIENVWAVIKTNMSKRRTPVRSADDLWSTVLTEWNTVREDGALIQNLYASLPRRMEAIIAVAGEAIGY